MQNSHFNGVFQCFILGFPTYIDKEAQISDDIVFHFRNLILDFLQHF